MAVHRKKYPDQGYIKEFLHYDPDTGNIRWRLDVSSNVKAGNIAGHIHKTTGYRMIGLNGEAYLAHRLAFIYVEGYDPEFEIDHEDQVRHNNKWLNIRHVTRSCNSKNGKIRVNNTSGVTGISFDHAHGKWKVRIRDKNGKEIHVGLYTHLKDAVIARYQAEVFHGYPNCSKSSAVEWLVEKGILSPAIQIILSRPLDVEETKRLVA